MTASASRRWRGSSDWVKAIVAETLSATRDRPDACGGRVVHEGPELADAPERVLRVDPNAVECLALAGRKLWFWSRTPFTR